MTATAARAAEPDHESDAHALLNTLLDLCERNVEAVIAAGGEVPLRARIARLLPSPVPTPSVPPSTPAPARNMARALNLLQVDAALDTAHRRLGGALARSQIDVARTVIAELLAEARGETPKTEGSTTP